MRMIKKSFSMLLAFCLLSTPSVLAQEEKMDSDLSTFYDYTPGEMPENLFSINSNAAKSYSTGVIRNGGSINSVMNNKVGVWVDSLGTWNRRVMWTQRDVTQSASHPFAGLTFKNKNDNQQFIAGRPVYLPDKSYVFKFNELRCETEEFSYSDTESCVPVVTDVRVGVAITNETTASHSYSKEFGKEGMLLTDEYCEMKGTIKVSPKFDSNALSSFVLGFPVGTVKNVAVDIGFNTADAVYVAEEKAYNIKNEKISGDELLKSENTLVFKAEVINQVGLIGYLNQEFTWNVLNSGGQVVTEDFDITEDGNTAYLKARAWTPSGKYIMVATSEEYDMSRFEEFEAFVVKPERKIYVSVNGDDANPGTEESPLKSIKGAKELIKSLKSEKDQWSYTVIFKEGTYYIDSRVTFDENDSGSYDAPITYMAEEGDKVVFRGSVDIDITNAKPVTDKGILKRLYPEVRDKVKVIDLRKEGFPYELSGEPKSNNPVGTMLVGYDYVDLYLDGTKQPIAQWPNGEGEYDRFSMNISTTAFKYKGSEPSRWTEAKDWWVGGYLAREYMYGRNYVAELNTSRKQITIAEPSSSQHYLGNANLSNRWKAFNLLEEIDVPGEWYIDKENMLLYYYVPDTEKTEIEMTVMKDIMLRLNKAENITFKNIEFTKTRGNAVQMTDVKNIVFDRCEFYDIAARGINVTGTKKAETDKNYWQRQYIDAAYNCKISNSIFRNIGGVSVNMDGGNVDTLTPGNNIIENNIFYSCAENAKYSNTVSVNGCGNIVRNNNISKLPFQAIYTMGNDHLIEYNEIYEICQEADDCGAIYSGRNTIARGVEVSYNYIHDMRGVEKYPLGHRPVIYWDDSQTGQYVHHNIIRNADIDIYTAGTDNRFEYNTSIDVDKSMYFKNGTAAQNTTEKVEGFGSVIANPELYYSKYKNLKTIIDNFGNTDILAPLSILKGNLGINIGSTDIGSLVTREGNVSVAACEDFVDAKNQDFRLIADSETAKLAEGVLNSSFDIEKMGIISDLDLTENGKADEFKTISPQNNEVITDYEDIYFRWEEAFGASHYRLMISDKNDFSNIIYEEKTPYNYATVKGEFEKGTYYWKVYAVNSSREFGCEWQSGASVFTCGEDIIIDSFIYGESENGGAVSATLINNSELPVTGTAYMAVYDTEGKLSGVKAKPIALGVNEQDELTSGVNGAESLKAVMYIWNKDNAPIILKKQVYIIKD